MTVGPPHDLSHIRLTDPPALESPGYILVDLSYYKISRRECAEALKRTASGLYWVQSTTIVLNGQLYLRVKPTALSELDLKQAIHDVLTEEQARKTSFIRFNPYLLDFKHIVINADLVDLPEATVRSRLMVRSRPAWLLKANVMREYTTDPRIIIRYEPSRELTKEHIEDAIRHLINGCTI